MLFGFRDKFQKRVTCVAFSIKFAKTIRNLPKILNFVKKIHYYSELFTSLLGREPRDDPGGPRGGAARDEGGRPRGDAEC